MTTTLHTDETFETLVEALDRREFFRADALVATVAARLGLSPKTVLDAARAELAV